MQRRLREVPGVSALVYDQTCAAEKRRRRKRGAFPDPDERVVINELVCEGCGDCGVASNCVAIQPVETEFGRKRRIDQSACNKDFSCLKGFCPSFVTVKGGRLRRGSAAGDVPFPVLPEPALPALDGPYGIVVTGVGGTGVITVAALLGMAAHLEGKGIAALDMIGLAQKGGAVLTPPQDRAHPGRDRRTAGRRRRQRGWCWAATSSWRPAPTRSRPCARASPRPSSTSRPSTTGDFTRAPDLDLPAERLRQAIVDAAGPGLASFVDAGRLARALIGDAIGANLFLVGFAWQRGLLPLSREAIERAIEVNGVAGRVQPSRLPLGPPRRARSGCRRGRDRRAPEPAAARTLDEPIAHRAEFLTAYQDAAYARRYPSASPRIRDAEARRVPGRTDLAEAVARNLFKLMAIKDEYEVARLWTDGSFLRQLGQEFEHWDALEVHLAPPLLAERDADDRPPARSAATAPGCCARSACSPGSSACAAPPSTRSAARPSAGWSAACWPSTRRSWTSWPSGWTRATTRPRSSSPASLQQIRGFGHVKEASVQRAKATQAALLDRWRSPPATLQAAE